MDTPDDLSDLLARVALKDRRAFRTLYERTAPKLFGLCLRILKSRPEAEEAVQEAYVKIWRNAASYRPDRGAPVTWMAAVARNQPVPDRLRTAVPEMSAADARDPSTRLPEPAFHLLQDTAGAAADGSDRMRFNDSVGRPDAASAEWESPPQANLPVRRSRAGVAFDADSEGDGLFAPDGAHAGPAGVGISGTGIFRRRVMEDLVHVTSREDREFERLEKTVQRLEARLDQQDARPQPAARPEPGGPRFVFVGGQPAAAPAASRAYWERSHLGRSGLRPRR